MGIILLLWKIIQTLLVLYLCVWTMILSFNISNNIKLSFILGFILGMIYTTIAIIFKLKHLWIYIFWLFASFIGYALFNYFKKGHA